MADKWVDEFNYGCVKLNSFVNGWMDGSIDQFIEKEDVGWIDATPWINASVDE